MVRLDRPVRVTARTLPGAGHRRSGRPVGVLASRVTALVTALALAACGSSGGPRQGAPAARPPSAHLSAHRTAPEGDAAAAAGPRTAYAPEPPVPAPTAPAPFVSPIRPDNSPTPVPGDVNGEMPARDLVGVAPGCTAARSAAPSLGLLMAAARDRGIRLGTEQCYRPLSDQVTVRRSWTSAGNSACAAPVVHSPAGHPVGTSMHGWGKAADFRDPSGSVPVGSSGYRFLEAQAGRLGWNHPGWARPGGGPCPETWHWEWVGDGGARHDSRVRADVAALLASPLGGGYATVTGLGAVQPTGAAVTAAPAPVPLGWLIVAAASTPSGHGYWLAGSDGGVFTRGDAGFFGAGSPPPADPVVAMAAGADGQGYWLATAAGRVLPRGAVASYGGADSLHPSWPVVAMMSTADGHGYWLVGSDGGVFCFGDASYHGATAGRPLPAPVVSAARTPDGGGYWLAGEDGSVYAFGDAPALGSAAGRAGAPVVAPVVAMAATPTGRGYWLAAADGRVYGFGDAAGTT